MAVTPYSSSTTLAQQLYDQQKSLAEQERSRNVGSLQEQLRQQRLNMQAGRQQLGEQGWATNRAIGQQAQSRGLGSSGLQNLSLIQSQLAQGQSVNQLEGSNAEVQKAAMGARGEISQAYQNNLRAADIGYNQQMVAADDSKRATLMSLYQMAQGGASTKDLATYASLAGYSLDDMTPEDRMALEGAVPDPTGNVAYKDKYGLYGIQNLAKKLGLSALNPILGQAAKDIVKKDIANTTTLQLTDSLGNKTPYKDWDDALTQINTKYANFEGYGTIKAVKGGNKVAFQIGGQGEKYSTYNEALAAAKERGLV